MSTGLAIWSAQPTAKLRALDAGIDEWEKALCAAAIEYYDTCFELGRRNKTDLGGKQPAEFAYGLTARALSTFLRVNALDGAEENSDGRVRQFLRRCVWATRRGCGQLAGVLARPCTDLGFPSTMVGGQVQFRRSDSWKAEAASDGHSEP